MDLIFILSCSTSATTLSAFVPCEAAFSFSCSFSSNNLTFSSVDEQWTIIIIIIIIIMTPVVLLIILLSVWYSYVHFLINNIAMCLLRFYNIIYLSNRLHFLWPYQHNNLCGMLGEYEKSLQITSWRRVIYKSFFVFSILFAIIMFYQK